MKICFIVGAFPPMKCGIGDYCSKVAMELAKNGNEIYAITSTKATTKIEGVTVLNIIEEWNFNSAKLIIEQLKQIQPDVVNIQFPSDEYKNSMVINFLPGMIKKKIKCQVTETIHEYECFTLKRKIRNYLTFKSMDKVIVVEDDFIELIKKDFKKTDITYIPISSSIPRSKITEKEKMLDKLNLQKKRVISFFGFATPAKGIESLLRCMTQLDNAHLLFINDLNEDNEYHKKLINMIDELGLKEKVAITGFLENEIDVANYLTISDVCVLPFVDGVKRRNSSFLAAYNQEIPVITTKMNKIENGKGIYYVQPNNDDELLETIKQVLSNKEDFKREELSWEEVAKSYLKCFKKSN